jgi:hypothetical protein
MHRLAFFRTAGAAAAASRHAALPSSWPTLVASRWLAAPPRVIILVVFLPVCGAIARCWVATWDAARAAVRSRPAVSPPVALPPVSPPVALPPVSPPVALRPASPLVALPPVSQLVVPRPLAATLARLPAVLRSDAVDCCNACSSTRIVAASRVVKSSAVSPLAALRPVSPAVARTSERVKCLSCVLAWADIARQRRTLGTPPRVFSFCFSGVAGPRSGSVGGGAGSSMTAATR